MVWVQQVGSTCIDSLQSFPTLSQVLSIKAVKWFRWKDVNKKRQAATPDNGMVARRGQEETTKIGTLHGHTRSMQLNSQEVACFNFASLCSCCMFFYVFSCLEKFANHSWSRNLWYDNLSYSRTVLESGGYQYRLLRISANMNFEILGIDEGFGFPGLVQSTITLRLPDWLPDKGSLGRCTGLFFIHFGDFGSVFNM